MKSMGKLFLGVLLVALLLSALMTGCGGGDSNTTSGSGTLSGSAK